MNIYNVNEVMVYDELWWDESLFSPHEIAIETLKTRYNQINDIVFYNIDQMIEFDLSTSSNINKLYFHDISAKLLNELAKYKPLRPAIKAYCKKNNLLPGPNTYHVLDILLTE